MLVNRKKICIFNRLNLSIILLSVLCSASILIACGDASTPASNVTATSATQPVGVTSPISTTTNATTGQPNNTAASIARNAAVAGPSNGYKISTTVKLNGSGASFPDKAYQKWISNFSVLNPSVTISYKSVGSGAGRKAFFADEVDFAGSDAYPTKTEMEAYAKPILTIPTTIGGVTIAYNLPGVTGLRLSPGILGGMYTGKIKQWNDAAIKAENSDLSLPDTAISFAVRADSSGTRDIFSKHLATVSPEFKALNIAGSQPEWGKGGIEVTKGNQNPGVAAAIKQTPGMIGYVDYGDAITQNLVTALIKNQSGQYIAPNPASFSQAEPVGGIPDNLQLQVANSANPKAYPITSTTWIIMPKDFKDKAKAEALVTYLWWITHDPEQIAQINPLGFAALPASVLPRLEESLKSVSANGQSVLK